MKVSKRVNGVNFKHDVEPRTLLVQYIRETLRLTRTMWAVTPVNVEPG